MKTISYSVAIAAACVAIIFSLIHSGKFQALEKDRLDTISNNKVVTANADATDTNIKKEKALLAASQEKLELLAQSISSLKSAQIALTSDNAKLTADLAVQDEEFTELAKALAEVNNILVDLGGGVTLDTLPDKIQQIDDDKKAKQAKLDDLEVLITGADKGLVTSREELDLLNRRMLERSARISRNSLEAVVTAVNQDWGFLVIGAGSNSGFSPQGDLLVQRDGRMIAQIHPSAIEATQTIAEINFKTLSAGVRLQPGDRVILAQPKAN